jgi:hypothetical protein
MPVADVMILVVLGAVAVAAVVVSQKPRNAVFLPDGGVRWGSFEHHERDDGFRWKDGSRGGFVDEKGKRLHVEGGFFGWGRVDRPLGDFYRVAVTTREESNHHDHYRRRNDLDFVVDLVTGPSSSPLSTSSWGGPRRYWYTLAVVDRHANEFALFTLEERPNEDTAQKPIGRVRARLEIALGVPDRMGIGSPLKHAPKAAADVSSVHTGRMMCPNCHQGQPLSVKTCPKCHVALFKDD